MAETKTRLSREAIIDTAFSLIDEQGVQSFSMRNLGARLGVSGMALYSYFGSREEIIDAACTKFMRYVDTSPIPGEFWDDTLRRTTASIRDVYLEYPNVASAINSSFAWSPSMREHTQRIITLHASQNMPEHILERTWALIDAFLTGFLINEIGMVAAQELPGDDSAEQWLKTARKAYTTDSFSSGIEILIAGIRGISAPDPCEWQTPYGISE
ncbi:MAG: TetR family transcriptional regulator [Actinobacteria bacterium]|nr:TetR family transcriptional regulator [Actinomycetota bacterium]